MQRLQSTLAHLKHSVFGRFLAKYGRDQADDHAALIAFSALFSLFPLIGGLLSLLGLIIQDASTMAALIEQINKLFPSQVADLLSFLQETRQISGLLGAVSLAGLLWSGSTLFGSMARAFNSFYQLQERGFVGQRVMAFTMIFIFVGLVVLSVGASGLTTFMLGLSAEASPLPLPDIGLLESLLGWGVSLGSAFLMFLAIFLVVPNGPLRLRGVWKGSLLGAILFVVINQFFPLYLRFLGGGFAAYKTLGLFLLLVTWFYFLARILVLGCELNAYLHPLPAAARSAEREAQPVAGSTGPNSTTAPTSLAPTGKTSKLGRWLLRAGLAAWIAVLVFQRRRRERT
jgi:membrane protein